MAVMIPVSWGELVDKITILQIKVEKISDKSKLLNVEKELAELSAVLKTAEPLLDEVSDLMGSLRSVNSRLWGIEDDIRNCERENRFDEEFIRLARAVYFENDERSDLKKQINLLMGSDLIEEKSYESYK